MPARSLTIAARLRKAFLKGQRFTALEFARRKPRTHVNSVHSELAAFGDIIRSDGGRWHCVDPVRMFAFVTPQVKERERRRSVPTRRYLREVVAPKAWTQLLTAWGIPTTPPDIALPSHFHTTITAEDHKTEQMA